MNSVIHLDKELLLALNGSDSMVLDQFMYWSTKTLCWLPVFLLLFYLVIKHNRLNQILLISCVIAVTIFLADGLSSGICKPFFARLRPTHDPEIMALVQTVNGYQGGLYSFFSSHAANTFSLFILLSLIIKSWRFAFTMFAWAALHTYTRIYLGVHFPGDILVGMVWGILVGVVMYMVYNRLSKKLYGRRAFVSQRCTSSGYVYSSIDWFCFTFLLNANGILLYSFFTC